MIYIIGNGISAIVASICLSKLNIEHQIYGSGDFIAPELLYLKNDKYNLFTDYPKEHIKVGYIGSDGNIYERLNQNLQTIYLNKQGRQQTDTMLSDGLAEFEAINLKQVYDDFDKNKIIDRRVTLDELNDGNIIFNTVFPFNENVKPSWLYVVPYQNQLSGYTYLYDCRQNSIKRFTKNAVEFITPQKRAIPIKNYYADAEVKIKDNIYYISRNASQTQLKIEDIIDFIFTRFGQNDIG